MRQNKMILQKKKEAGKFPEFMYKTTYVNNTMRLAKTAREEEYNPIIKKSLNFINVLPNNQKQKLFVQIKASLNEIQKNHKRIFEELTQSKSKSKKTKYECPINLNQIEERQTRRKSAINIDKDDDKKEIKSKQNPRVAEIKKEEKTKADLQGNTITSEAELAKTFELLNTSVKPLTRGQKGLKAIAKMRKLGLTPLDVMNGVVFSHKPYEKKGSHGFLTAIKLGNIQLVKQYLKQNKYYVYDFDHVI